MTFGGSTLTLRSFAKGSAVACKNSIDATKDTFGQPHAACTSNTWTLSVDAVTGPGSGTEPYIDFRWDITPCKQWDDGDNIEHCHRGKANTATDGWWTISSAGTNFRLRHAHTDLAKRIIFDVAIPAGFLSTNNHMQLRVTYNSATRAYSMETRDPTVVDLALSDDTFWTVVGSGTGADTYVVFAGSGATAQILTARDLGVTAGTGRLCGWYYKSFGTVVANFNPNTHMPLTPDVHLGDSGWTDDQGILHKVNDDPEGYYEDIG